MYRRSFPCEEVKIKQHTSSKKELCEIGKEAISESRLTRFSLILYFIHKYLCINFRTIQIHVSHDRSVDSSQSLRHHLRFYIVESQRSHRSFLISCYGKRDTLFTSTKSEMQKPTFPFLSYIKTVTCFRATFTHLLAQICPFAFPLRTIRVHAMYIQIYRCIATNTRIRFAWRKARRRRSISWSPVMMTRRVNGMNVNCLRSARASTLTHSPNVESLLDANSRSAFNAIPFFFYLQNNSFNVLLNSVAIIYIYIDSVKNLLSLKLVKRPSFPDV